MYSLDTNKTCFYNIINDLTHHFEFLSDYYILTNNQEQFIYNNKWNKNKSIKSVCLIQQYLINYFLLLYIIEKPKKIE